MSRLIVAASIATVAATAGLVIWIIQELKTILRENGVIA